MNDAITVKVRVPTFQEYFVIIEDGSGVEFEVSFVGGEATIVKKTPATDSQ